jgi:hypothetical protein
MGPRAGVVAEARRKILCPCRGSNPDRPDRSQTLYCLSYRSSFIEGVGEFIFDLCRCNITDISNDFISKKIIIVQKFLPKM